MTSTTSDHNSADDPIATLLTTYSELNPSRVDELTAIPTPLEFMRYVAKNRPFIVRDAAEDWPAVRDWSAAHLLQTLGSHPVNVSVTPFGNADALAQTPSGGTLFVEPHEQTEPFDKFLNYVRTQAANQNPGNRTPRGNIKYAQTQNDNLRSEYSHLFTSIPSSVTFVDEALEQEPDAINFWLGNSHSTTALHKDNYENIYVQVRGEKHFTLLPPLAQACVNERMTGTARYVPVFVGSEELEIRPNGAEVPDIPVAMWDPADPGVNATPYSQLAKGLVLQAKLKQGDLLYLPALWYHRVAQGEGEEGFSCSVNYWYDMGFEGGAWALAGFVRDVGNAVVEGRGVGGVGGEGKRKRVEYPELVMGEPNEGGRR